MSKKKMLGKQGRKVGTAEEFLGLSPVGSRYVDRLPGLAHGPPSILPNPFLAGLSP